MMIYNTQDIYCHTFLLLDRSYERGVSSFLTRNLDYRNITVEETETVD